jgi:hypothetical protein
MLSIDGQAKTYMLDLGGQVEESMEVETRQVLRWLLGKSHDISRGSHDIWVELLRRLSCCAGRPAALIDLLLRSTCCFDRPAASIDLLLRLTS